MKNEITVKEITQKIEKSSTDFEKTNTELKRKYLLWNIEAFNIVASKISNNRGTFGTGYPFYALDENLQGKLPIIQEQIRYNRQLVRDGETVQKSIWECKKCLEEKYRDMPDLKKICKPCPNILNELKPRKLINRLPDIDMWIICKDGKVEEVEEQLAKLLEEFNMRTSDVNPILAIDDVGKISEMIGKGEAPKKFLPMDVHIMEYSKMKELIKEVPKILRTAKQEEKVPYLPIQPKSYRKTWQYDDEAYNFIYDYLSAFTPFNFTEELQTILENSRKEVATQNTKEELLDFLLKSATKANFRRFQSMELEKIFLNRIEGWKRPEKGTISKIKESLVEEDQLEL